MRVLALSSPFRDPSSLHRFSIPTPEQTLVCEVNGRRSMEFTHFLLLVANGRCNCLQDPSLIILAACEALDCSIARDALRQSSHISLKHIKFLKFPLDRSVMTRRCGRRRGRCKSRRKPRESRAAMPPVFRILTTLFLRVPFAVGNVLFRRALAYFGLAQRETHWTISQEIFHAAARTMAQHAIFTSGALRSDWNTGKVRVELREKSPRGLPDGLEREVWRVERAASGDPIAVEATWRKEIDLNDKAKTRVIVMWHGLVSAGHVIESDH